LGAAAGRRGSSDGPRTGGDSDNPPPFRYVSFVVPAHNEEAVLAATIQSLTAQEYPRERFSILVVADNCDDRTAQIARDHGAEVWERTNPDERGKGYALAWAVERLLAAPEPADAFFIVDADTKAAPDFLTRLAWSLYRRQDPAGRCALQGRYGVLNPGEGWRTALMGAAFDLVNHVRPLGADALGFSVDLKGNGMGFTRPVFETAPWSGRSITEDLDYGLDLLEKYGIPVGYEPSARVWAEMPTGAKASASQRDRWERGRRILTKERAFPLLLGGLRRNDGRLVEAGARLVVPPLAELFVLAVLWSLAVVVIGAFGWLPGSPMLWHGAVALLWFGLFVYLLGGLRVAGAGVQAYSALLYAPVYAVWKLARYAVRPRDKRGAEASPEWVRTARNAAKETVTPS
jgi:glycosyltransferase involved in cell wall biosynthesis